MNDLYKQCYKAFRADEHEWLQNKYIYVTVNSTIQRLNELYDGAGYSIGWSLTHKDSSLVETVDNKGRPSYLTTCSAELTIPGLGTRMGSGAATNGDPDNSFKAAQAYALRKAGNQFGVTHYLLMNPEAESNLVKHLLNNDPDDTEAMKEAVVMLMKIRNLEVSAANLVQEFDIDLEQLKTDSEVWRKILVGENRI